MSAISGIFSEAVRNDGVVMPGEWTTLKPQFQKLAANPVALEASLKPLADDGTIVVMPAVLGELKTVAPSTSLNLQKLLQKARDQATIASLVLAKADDGNGLNYEEWEWVYRGQADWKEIFGAQGLVALRELYGTSLLCGGINFFIAIAIERGLWTDQRTLDSLARLVPLGLQGDLLAAYRAKIDSGEIKRSAAKKGGGGLGKGKPPGAGTGATGGAADPSLLFGGGGGK